MYSHKNTKTDEQNTTDCSQNNNHVVVAPMVWSNPCISSSSVSKTSASMHLFSLNIVAGLRSSCISVANVLAKDRSGVGGVNLSAMLLQEAQLLIVLCFLFVFLPQCAATLSRWRLTRIVPSLVSGHIFGNMGRGQ